MAVPARFVIVRHAQSTNNLLEHPRSNPNRLPDPPITEAGHKQAEAVAKYLKTKYGEELDENTRIYVSPMTRTMNTCKPIVRELAVPVILWPKIHEQGGCFDSTKRDSNGENVGLGGNSKQDLLQIIPELRFDCPDGPCDDLVEGGWWGKEKGRENLETTFERAKQIGSWMKQTAAEGRVKTTFLVTHGLFTDILLKSLFQIPPELQGKDKSWFHLNNCAVAEVRVSEEGRICLQTLNETSHLAKELIT